MHSNAACSSRAITQTIEQTVQQTCISYTLLCGRTKNIPARSFRWIDSIRKLKAISKSVYAVICFHFGIQPQCTTISLRTCSTLKVLHSDFDVARSCFIHMPTGRQRGRNGNYVSPKLRHWCRPGTTARCVQYSVQNQWQGRVLFLSVMCMVWWTKRGNIGPKYLHGFPMHKFINCELWK